MEVDLVLHGAADLTLHLFFAVCLLVLVVDVVDSDFVVLTPKLRDRKLDDFQAILLLVDCVDEDVVGGGLLVYRNKNRKGNK